MHVPRRVADTFRGIALAVITTLCLGPSDGAAQDRPAAVALVIVADTHAAGGRAVAETLSDAGFDVVLSVAPATETVIRAVEAFAAQAATASHAVVFYGGPVVTDEDNEVRLGQGPDAAGGAGAGLRLADLAAAAAPSREFSLVILDTTGAEAEGLARLFLTASLARAETQAILWSGRTPLVAHDGDDKESPFAHALAERLDDDVTLREMVSGVRADTFRASKQRPLVQYGRETLDRQVTVATDRGNGAAPVFLEAERGLEGGWATRIFAGPGQFPPEDFRTYGIVAFPALAAGEAELGRHRAICEAWAAVLPSAERNRAELPPPDRQMATIWPIAEDTLARKLNLLAAPCEEAVAGYGLVRSLKALRAARQAGFGVSGEGPFLLAWSPPSTMGAGDAVILAMDLTGVRTHDEAVAVFRSWRADIESNPELWGDDGWSLEAVRVALRRWADLYGPRLLNVING